ncbi:hypothetical protein HOY82DRAFT_554819 [Tuber indicum]|nr:hypothetical protein HOY82DRAFT_554819 [Tuber indicum]
MLLLRVGTHTDMINIYLSRLLFLLLLFPSLFIHLAQKIKSRDFRRSVIFSVARTPSLDFWSLPCCVTPINPDKGRYACQSIKK